MRKATKRLSKHSVISRTFTASWLGSLRKWIHCPMMIKVLSSTKHCVAYSSEVKLPTSRAVGSFGLESLWGNSSPQPYRYVMPNWKPQKSSTILSYHSWLIQTLNFWWSMLKRQMEWDGIQACHSRWHISRPSRTSIKNSMEPLFTT